MKNRVTNYAKKSETGFTTKSIMKAVFQKVNSNYDPWIVALGGTAIAILYFSK